MAKNTGKVREFCQCGKVGTLPSYFSFIAKSMVYIKCRNYIKFFI